MPPARSTGWSVSRLGTLALALVGGGVLSLAFPDVGWWPAAPAAVAVLLCAMRRDHAGWNLLVGWVFSTAFFLIHLEFANYAVGPVPWVMLAAAEGLAVGLVAVTWTWLRRLRPFTARPWLSVPVVATLWTGAEELRSVFPFGGFPWGRLAFSQASSPLAPLAWLGGATWVSWVTCAAGVCLYVAVASWGTSWVRGTRLAVAAVVLVLVGLVVPLDAAPESGELRVGAVQGDVEHPGLHAYDQAREVLDNHLAGTAALAAQTADDPLDVVLWPENGTDIDPTADATTWDQIDAAAEQVGAPILVGAIHYPASGGRYNVGLLWEPGIGPVDSYTKIHPVPFAEYVPLRSLARRFSSAVDLVTRDMLPGTRVGVLSLPSQRLGRTVLLGDVICFEVAIDPLVRATVAHGAEMLVVQTNNASFGPTAESTQQLAMTRLRAIETGRSTVQVSTVGVSAIVAPDGTVLDSAGLFTAAQLSATVPLRTGITPAVRWGAWVSSALTGLAAVLAASALAGRWGIGSLFVPARSRRGRRADDDAAPGPEPDQASDPAADAS